MIGIIKGIVGWMKRVKPTGFNRTLFGAGVVLLLVLVYVFANPSANAETETENTDTADFNPEINTKDNINVVEDVSSKYNQKIHEGNSEAVGTDAQDIYGIWKTKKSFQNIKEEAIEFKKNGRYVWEQETAGRKLSETGTWELKTTIVDGEIRGKYTKGEYKYLVLSNRIQKIFDKHDKSETEIGLMQTDFRIEEGCIVGPTHNGRVLERNWQKT